jgi:hypothetical protein
MPPEYSYISLYTGTCARSTLQREHASNAMKCIDTYTKLLVAADRLIRDILSSVHVLAAMLMRPWLPPVTLCMPYNHNQCVEKFQHPRAFPEGPSFGSNPCSLTCLSMYCNDHLGVMGRCLGT